MRGKPHPDLDAAYCEQFSPWTKCLRLLRNLIFSIESGDPRLNGSSGMYIWFGCQNTTFVLINAS
jgi:hypothetical protein